jgi:hypothetical protein
LARAREAAEAAWLEASEAYEAAATDRNGTARAAS